MSHARGRGGVGSKSSATTPAPSEATAPLRQIEARTQLRLHAAAALHTAARADSAGSAAVRSTMSLPAGALAHAALDVQAAWRETAHRLTEAAAAADRTAAAAMALSRELVATDRTPAGRALAKRLGVETAPKQEGSAANG